MTVFAETLSKILDMKGLRKSDLVNNLNIPDSTVRGWWSKETTPSADLAFRVAQYLGVSVEYLVTGKTPGAKPQKHEELTMLEKKIALLNEAQKKILENVADGFLNTDNGKVLEVV